MDFWRLGFWRVGFWRDRFWVGTAGGGAESAGEIQPGFVMCVIQYPEVQLDLPQETPPV